MKKPHYTGFESRIFQMSTLVNIWISIEFLGNLSLSRKFIFISFNFAHFFFLFITGFRVSLFQTFLGYKTYE